MQMQSSYLIYSFTDFINLFSVVNTTQHCPFCNQAEMLEIYKGGTKMKTIMLVIAVTLLVL